MLKDKAVENLAAGNLLVERGHANAAASRYYYAMFQAAVHRLNLKGWKPGAVRSGAVDWDHSMVLNNLGRIGGRWNEKLLCMEMRNLRVLADYAADSVPAQQLLDRHEAIEDMVRRLTA